MLKIQDGSVYNIPIPTYYVESMAEMAQIPSTAPAGTIVEVNASTGFKVYMKNTAGQFNEL